MSIIKKILACSAGTLIILSALFWSLIIIGIVFALFGIL